MDPGFATSALPTPPVVVDAAVLVATGFLPQAIPLEVYGPASRAALAGLPGLAVERQVGFLFDAGLDERALTVAAGVARPLGSEGRLELVLARWAAAEQARLGLPLGDGGVIVVGTIQPRQIGAAVSALAMVRRELSVLPWPRWAGPVVVVLGNEPFPGLPPGETSLVRPALPCLRLGSRDPTRNEAGLQTALVERFARLAIDCCAPPAAGWPAWVRRGLPLALAGYLDGRLPPAAALTRQRTDAGPQRLAEARAATGEPDDLALALAAPWLAGERRRQLTSLLDHLRSGIGVDESLRLTLPVGDPLRP